MKSMSRSFFWVDGSRKKKLSCMHLSMSWKISPRSASSCRRQAHGDFQSFVRCQTRRAFCLGGGLHTLSSSASGSIEDSRSFGFSIYFRKWSRRDEYALLESESFFGQDD